MHLQVKPSRLSGSITIPPSKSHTLRAILFASLAKGKSTIHHYLISPDTLSMVNACRAFGAEIEMDSQKIIISGVNGKLQPNQHIIDAGNSGQVLRFIAALFALTDHEIILTGDHSIQTNRPIQPLLSALSQLNVATSSKNGFAPIKIKGPFLGGKAFLNGEDSQPVSGLLIASAFAPNETIIHVENPGEKPWVDLTLHWFDRLGIRYQREGHERYVLFGNSGYEGFDYTVPGDLSSAAFPVVAALITQSEITLENIDLNDIQGDKALFFTLQKMGAVLDWCSDKKLLHVKKSSLVGGEINVNCFIDAVTILAVVASYAKSETKITGAAIARKKESDRLLAITQELSKMGASIRDFDDGLIIQPANLKGARVLSYNDHRVAMSLAVAGLGASSRETIIEDAHCIAKSYPDFCREMQLIHASIGEC